MRVTIETADQAFNTLEVKPEGHLQQFCFRAGFLRNDRGFQAQINKKAYKAGIKAREHFDTFQQEIKKSLKNRFKLELDV